jgi:hypothetical protein
MVALALTGGLPFALPCGPVFGVLLLGTVLGTNLRALAWNEGAWFVGASTVLFAIDFVIAKHLLRGLATLEQVAHLGPTQWHFVVITGVILPDSSSVRAWPSIPRCPRKRLD